MKSDTYHHGNLKEELIEKGLEYIHRYGTENLSMRKLAESAGVSPAAPYAHFKSKEAFLTAVRDHITERFSATLTEAADSCSDKSRVLLDLGKSYVLFFCKNPLYYQFLFAREDIDTETYRPFLLFRGIAEMVIKETSQGKATEDTVRAKVIALWALVHGLASVVTIKGAVDTEHLEEEIERILGAVTV
jgi:AcrR family transcriptional regulator